MQPLPEWLMSLDEEDLRSTRPSGLLRPKEQEPLHDEVSEPQHQDAGPKQAATEQTDSHEQK